MKSQVPLIGLLATLLAASGSVGAIPSAEFQAQLSSIEQNFSTQGPTLDVLGQYETLLRFSPDDMDLGEKSMLLAKVFYKKAIIGLSLGKESQSIQDFERSLELNPHNDGVKKNLLGLIVKYGQKEKLDRVSKLISRDDPDLAQTKVELELIEQLSNSADLGKLGEAIQLAPFDTWLREKRIALTEAKIKESTDRKERETFFADLADDLDIMIKVNPATNSENWNKLAEIYLFGLGEFVPALNANRKCLHYDMDFDACKKNSKFLNKYNSILTQITTHNKYYQYIQHGTEEDDPIILEEMDIKDLASLLTNPAKFLKIRRENEDFTTNLDYLLFKSSSFNMQYSLKVNALESTIYESLAMDALLRHDAKSFRRYASQTSQDSLARRLDVIDRALHKKDFSKAQQAIQNAPKTMQSTHFFQSRLEKIQHHIQQQQQQQRRQQQQQHQQQFRPQQPKPPKNDYYKILGVPRDADERTIKKAYRDLTKQFHPDKYRGDMSSEDVEHKMTQINHAYEVLSDEQMRKDYDAGHDPNDPESQGGQGGGQPFGGQRQRQGGNPFGGFNFNFGGSQFGNMKFQQKGQKRRQ